MDNKREIIVKKIEKYGFNVKILNAIIAVMVAIFTIAFFVVYSKEKAKYDLENVNYAARLKQIEQDQLNSIFGNVSPNSGTVNKKEVEQPMFKNAKEAVVFAFDKFYNYNTYEIETTGFSVTDVVGQHVEVMLQTKSCKWDDGLEYEQNMMYETKTDFGQSKATECVYKNGKYVREGKNLRNNNGTLMADFSGAYKKVDSSLTKKSGLIVNNQTILQSVSYSFIRDKNNKILYYTACVRLDTEESIRTYGQCIKEEGGTSYPIFSELELTCNIDRDGNLINYSSHERMTVSKSIVILGAVTATLTNDYITVIKSYNQVPSIPRNIEIA